MVFERGQLGLRISFRLDDPEALVMLHGQSARDHLEEHQLAPPGVALVQAPPGRWAGSADRG
ncbi:hypothetical protein [Pseudonocardia sp. Ae717_Ps2]|uniref:hypothetical protein n=1 Tax=Pseudonocardia sp. Ae717_Ps2 TaxID=1885573 RepID=UPI00094AEC5A|nr:hypothetical protein [Pseudonocardia sp. Ae717_Ps2]